MTFFRLRSVAGNRWPPISEGSLSQVWAAYLTLNRTQWLDPAELERHQLIQFRALLDHCLEHVPYYRQSLGAHGITSRSIQSMDDFRRLPLLSRRTWQTEFDDLCARHLPPGTVALDEDNTSGTSGVPIRILKTNIFYLWWLAFYLRDLEWSGLNPTGTMAAIRATHATGPELERLLMGEAMPSWNPILEPLLEMGPLYGMDIAQEPRRQIEWLREVNPDYLLSHTSNLELLSEMLRDEPRRFPRLRAIQAISETLTEAAPGKEIDEVAFGAPVKNLYSQCRGRLPRLVRRAPPWHVHAENVILEVLDDANLGPCSRASPAEWS